MSRSGHKKEKYGKSGDLPLVNSDKGTAARTRPFSFDEIMIRRKNKKLPENVKEGDREVHDIPEDGTVENVSDHHESERHHRNNKGSSPDVGKRLQESVKVGSRRKEDNNPMIDGNSARQKYRERRESETKVKDGSSGRSKPRESHESEIRLNDRSLAKQKDRESHRSETKLKAEMKKESFSKAKGKTDKQISGREKNYRCSSDVSEDEATKKHIRSSTAKDRHVDRSGEKSEREVKRKYRNGDDEKYRDKSAAKRHDLGKGRDLEISERKERKESPKPHNGESRPKRRRSRSREHESRNRRSISLSPKAQRRSSHYGREHEEQSSQSIKGRSGRQNSDTDKNSRATSNGSSSHYRRHGGSMSGLGGYSPRKRRSEAAIKTPSPINRSPEKKSAKWDIAPAGKDSTFSGSVPFNFQASNQTTSSNVHEVVRSVPVTSTAVEPLVGVSNDASLTKQNISMDSAQLTQATRSMRRLYVENIPASAYEKSVIEFFNNFLISSGVNFSHGSLPCTNCIIQNEKGQALVEFLTPEDASAALSCDGSFFSGSILKIRRPKDFADIASGEAEKSVAAVDVIIDIVKDSPHKIFVGGISKTLSSKMVMEIVSAFGPLKAYRFELNEDREPCAFVEYIDQSVTSKAIAGLNGMKLGGEVVTAVQAVPDGSSLENGGDPPFYGVPEHVLPLLEKPTQVLRLKNVLNPEGLTSLSELEVEEVLEDVRLECARFGAVKAVNVVKYGDSHITTSEECKANENMASARALLNSRCNETNEKSESLVEVNDHQSRGINGLEFPSEAKEVEESNINIDNKPVGELVGYDKLDSIKAVEDPSRERVPETFSEEFPKQLNSFKDDSCYDDSVVACNTEIEDVSLENKSSAEEELNLKEVKRNLQEAAAGMAEEELNIKEVNRNLQEAAAGSEIKSEDVENDDNKKQGRNLGDIFEPGCVFVEYRRTEASSMAAHCLHGRLFDDRVVTVEYVPLDLYKARFSK